jgi:hypothetical protein
MGFVNKKPPAGRAGGSLREGYEGGEKMHQACFCFLKKSRRFCRASTPNTTIKDTKITEGMIVSISSLQFLLMKYYPSFFDGHLRNG